MEKSSKINELRVSRIKELIEREGIKQVDLADAIDVEPQNLSRCLRSGKVSEKTCRKIQEHYPDYRIEWLLGYDSAPTWYEWADNIQFRNDKCADGMWAIFERSLNKKGLSLKFHHKAGVHLDSTQRLHGDCFYTVEDHEGTEVKRLTALQMVELEQKIQEYTDFVCEKYLE